MGKIKFIKFDWNYLILFLGLLAYSPLINSYFVLDEWNTFSRFLGFGSSSYLQVIKSFIYSQDGQYLPVTQIFTYTVFLYARLNYYIYFFLGMALHFLVAILLYKFITKIISNRKIALISSLFFIFSPQHFQGTSWVIANFGYFISSVFLLSSLMIFILWIKNNSQKPISNQIIVSILLLLSLLTKDIGVFGIIAIPILSVVWSRWLTKLKDAILVVTPSVLLIMWKFFTIRSHPQIDFDVSADAGLLNLITLPMRSLVQSIFPQNIIYFFSRWLVIISTPATISDTATTAFNQSVESVGALMVVLLITILLVMLSVFIYRNQRKIFDLYLTGILIASLSGLSYFFVDSKIFSLLAPRYIYVAVAGITLSIASIFSIRWKNNKLIYFLLFVYMTFLFFSTTTNSIKTTNDNILRKQILESVKLKIPNYQKDLVILVESDKSYYGLPDNTKTVPFLASPAIVFAVYLNDKIYLPKKVLKYETFQKFDSQGYIFDENGSYGYYWNFNLLKSDFSKYKFKIDSIYSFKFDSGKQILLDQTTEVRKKLLD